MAAESYFVMWPFSAAAGSVGVGAGKHRAIMAVPEAVNDWGLGGQIVNLRSNQPIRGVRLVTC